MEQTAPLKSATSYRRLEGCRNWVHDSLPRGSPTTCGFTVSESTV